MEVLRSFSAGMQRGRPLDLSGTATSVMSQDCESFSETVGGGRRSLTTSVLHMVLDFSQRSQILDHEF